ncbi:hypothetical protein V8E36_005127 [Tilletia maclaganii]
MIALVPTARASSLLRSASRSPTRALDVSSRRWQSTSPTSSARLPIVTVFTGPQCSLCDEMKRDIRSVQEEHPFDLETYNIHDTALPDQPKWQKLYIFDIPVLHVGGREVLRHRVTAANRVKLVNALRDELEALEERGKEAWRGLPGATRERSSLLKSVTSLLPPKRDES